MNIGVQSGDSTHAHTGKIHGIRSQSYGGTPAGRSSLSLNDSPRGRVSQQQQENNKTSNTCRQYGKGATGSTGMTSDTNRDYPFLHLKRVAQPNSKVSVIVGIEYPTNPKNNPEAKNRKVGASEGVENNNNHNNNSSARTVHSQQKPLSERPTNNLEETPFTIGGKTFDVPDRRVKKQVAGPQPKVLKARPLLAKPNESSSLLPGPAFGSSSEKNAFENNNNNNNNNALVVQPAAKSGKHIEKQQPQQLQGKDGIVRFTRPPFWDEDSKAPRGHEFSKPTNQFRIPKIFIDREKERQLRKMKQEQIAVNEASITTVRRGSGSSQGVVGGGDVSSSSFPQRQQQQQQQQQRQKDRESSVASSSASSDAAPFQRSASAPAASTGRRRSSSVSSNDSSQFSSLFLLANSPQTLFAKKKNESVIDECLPGVLKPGQPCKKTIVDHDGHRNDNGPKRCFTSRARPLNLCAPTFANSETKVFRYCRPEHEGSGKSTAGNERKTRNNPALSYGTNFASGTDDIRYMKENPVGKAYRRACTPQPVVVNNNDNNNNNNINNRKFERSGSNSNNSGYGSSSMFDAPYDCSTNSGKYDITYESRTTSRSWKPYVRPLLKKDVPTLTQIFEGHAK